ncbi:hypothetical protein CCACVL1_20446 [Corchorus capsularis]|uniref:RNase H type-1 domain-containing protein n=1 Tax=Corchorus capsularis TaxID=210143 RepID=A0A1R3HB45_COCAP|nr:hypothetical protein CCACVL1_20446 [Corchorus capsularis]
MARMIGLDIVYHLRNNNGMQLARNFLWGESEAAELWGLREGLKLARDNNLQQLMI